jgi:SAM-dependent methyltransferase
VLEIGTGVGGLATWLARRYSYVGVEPNAESRATTAERLASVGAGRVVESLDEIGDTTFDLVCAFEVLEHIEDELDALRRWRQRVRSGGWLSLSFPAHASRYGPHDELAGHLRRYDRDFVRERLATAGFEVDALFSYGAGGGQALEHLRDFRARRRGTSGTVEERTSISGHLFQPKGGRIVMLNAACALPLRAIQRPFRDTDVGIGYVVLARRTEETVRAPAP